MSDVLVTIPGLKRCKPNNRIARRFKRMMARCGTPVSSINVFRIDDPSARWLTCFDEYGPLPSLIFPDKPAKLLRISLAIIVSEASVISEIRKAIADLQPAGRFLYQTKFAGAYIAGIIVRTGDVVLAAGSDDVDAYARLWRKVEACTPAVLAGSIARGAECQSS